MIPECTTSIRQWYLHGSYPPRSQAMPSPSMTPDARNPKVSFYTFRVQITHEIVIHLGRFVCDELGNLSNGNGLTLQQLVLGVKQDEKIFDVPDHVG